MNKEAENNRAVLNQVSQSIPSESSNVGLGTRQIMEILWLCPAGILFSVIVIINVQLSKKLRRSRELLGVRGKVKIYRTVFLWKGTSQTVWFNGKKRISLYDSADE